MKKILPCGCETQYNISCKDCYGFEVCTKAEKEDNSKVQEESLKEALKNTMGFNIDGIKVMFDK